MWAVNFFLKIRKKNGLLDVLNKSRSNLFIHTSSFFGFKQFYCNCFFPIVIDPNNKNLLIYINVGVKDIELKFIKNRLRSTISQEKLESFMMMSVEKVIGGNIIWRYFRTCETKLTINETNVKLNI